VFPLDEGISEGKAPVVEDVLAPPAHRASEPLESGDIAGVSGFSPGIEVSDG